MKENPITILVVDDEESLRDIYVTKLSGAGYVVEHACDGCEALQKIVRLSPSLVLLDIVMPERAGIFDGFDVLRHIKNDERMDDVKVVFMSNLGMSEDIKKGMSLGARDYIVKTNATPDEVLVVVQRVLGKE